MAFRHAGTAADLLAFAYGITRGRHSIPRPPAPAVQQPPTPPPMAPDPDALARFQDALARADAIFEDHHPTGIDQETWAFWLGAFAYRTCILRAAREAWGPDDN